MQIWLGKQYLGQRDQGMVALTGPDGGPFQTEEVRTSPYTREQALAKMRALLEKGAARLGLSPPPEDEKLSLRLTTTEP